MLQVIKKACITILVMILTFSPLRIDFFYLAQNALAEDEPQPLEDLYITEDTTWNSNTDLSNYERISVEYGATLTIEKGTKLALRHLSIYGTLIAIGTKEEKITLTKIPPTQYEDGIYDPLCFIQPAGILEFDGPGDYEDDPESVLEFVEFSQMGWYYEYDKSNCPGLGLNNSIRDMFVPTAYAAMEKKFSPAVNVRYGKISMKNCTFDGNAYADVNVEMEITNEWNTQSYLHIENSNFKNNSQNTALISSVVNTEMRNTLWESCYEECKSHYPGDYSVYGEVCQSSCNNVAENDSSIHDKTKIVLKNNWYGDARGPRLDSQTVTDGESIDGDYTLENWSDKEFGIESAGASNVLFLPGIKASRLYKNGTLGTEDKLWPPNYFGNDLDNLALDDNGNSIENVYTKDILDEVAFPKLGSNLYKSFIADLEDMKDGNIINDFESFAYDWRQNVEDIAQKGTSYEGGITKKVTNDILTLASSSKDGKVTIVAHSNGGLVAKATMIELEKLGISDKVDKVIFVGTPQMGTPLAILSMLYGYDESQLLGTLISRKEARKLSENMPGAYGLLPSEKYFNHTDNWFINFISENIDNNIFAKVYGEKIDSYGEFKKFLLGKSDGREDPGEDDVENENVLNEKLLEEASSMHQRLDGWVPPSSVEVIQIAGWGLDTVSGIKYKEEEKTNCQLATANGLPYCLGTGEYDLIYEPEFTVDGDAVVTAPSALMFINADNVNKYWVDLYMNNMGISIDREHKDILEISNVRQIILDSIEGKNASLPEFITASRPDDYDGAKSRLRMSLYSPLDIHLYDEVGNHTGPIELIDERGNPYIDFEEDIPNSYYYQFGERKYVGFPSGENIRIEMDGYRLGSYTVKFDEVSITEDGEENILRASFRNLLTTEKTKVALNISANGLKDISTLRADIDSDGKVDYEEEPVLIVPSADEMAPKTKATLSGDRGAEEWFWGDATITLEAEDSQDGSGIAITEYSSDGKNWNQYIEPIVISQEGITNLFYKSVDNAGNVEIARAVEIKIDKIAPEAKMIFNEKTQKLDINGMDEVSQDVSVNLTAQPKLKKNNKQAKKIGQWFLDWQKRDSERHLQNWVATLEDESGHTTILVFKKIKEKNNRIFLSLRSIAYDGVEKTLENARMQYKWQVNKKNQFNQLATHFRSADMIFESHYLSKRNETWIMEKPRELRDDSLDDEIEVRPIKTILSGMVIPNMTTEKGELKINY